MAKASAAKSAKKGGSTSGRKSSSAKKSAGKKSAGPTRNAAAQISAGACMPMYMTPGLDISQEVVNALNAKYPATAGAAPAPGGTAH